MKKQKDIHSLLELPEEAEVWNLAVCVPKDVSCELLLYKKGRKRTRSGNRNAGRRRNRRSPLPGAGRSGGNPV